MARAGLSTERVVHAGADLADEIGFEAVTAAELSRRLGVQTASLYSHVRGTPDLKTRIATLSLNELADLAAEAIAGRERAAALEAMAGVYRDFARRHPGRFAAILWTQGDDAALIDAARRHARLAEAVLRGYRLDGDDVIHAIRMLGSTLRGFAILEQNGSFARSDPPSADSWPHAVAALDVLFENWPTLAQTPAHPKDLA